MITQKIFDMKVEHKAFNEDFLFLTGKSSWGQLNSAFKREH